MYLYMVPENKISHGAVPQLQTGNSKRPVNRLSCRIRDSIVEFIEVIVGVA